MKSVMKSMHTLGRLGAALMVAFCLSVWALVVTSSPAGACSCVPMTWQERFDTADVVFDGIAVHRAAEGDANGFFVFTFVETKSLKGKAELIPRVRTHQQSATCGQGFDTGGWYRVYAQIDEEGTQHTNLCLGSTLVDSVPGDERARPGEAPSLGWLAPESSPTRV